MLSRIPANDAQDRRRSRRRDIICRSVGVNAFAWPDMLLEIAATAAGEK
jgi:hypothetical protein